MAGKQLNYDLRKIKKVKTWQLVFLLIIFLIITATFLRLNNIGMVERRSAVEAADKSLNESDITSRLLDLQHYSASHMNADTGAFYLKNLYQKLADQAKGKAQSQLDGDQVNIYKKVDDEVCAPLAKANNWRWPDERYTDCLSDALAKYPAAKNISVTQYLPNANLFRYSFVSPRWSADFAGFSVIIMFLLIVIIIIRVLFQIILRIVLKLSRK